jgi:hypothetical protein
VAYTDLLNEGLDDLADFLGDVTGLRVITDATKIVPNCCFIDAPSFEAWGGNGNIVKLSFPVKILGSGPVGLPVLRQLLSITAKVLGSGVIVMRAAPSTFAVGGADYPCYDLFIAIQAQDH